MKFLPWFLLVCTSLVLGFTATTAQASGVAIDQNPVLAKTLTKAGDNPPTNPPSKNAIDLLYNQGIAKYQAGDLSGALQAFEAALKLRPNFLEALVNSANVLDDLGRTPEAIDRYGLALAQSNSDPNIYYNRGLAYSRLSQYPQAISDYNKSIALNAEYPFPYQGRALIKYEKLGDKKGGLQDLKTAAEIYQRQGNKSKFDELMGLYKKLGG
jgi:tetratricopeptide (TPR) repeat protein